MEKNIMEEQKKRGSNLSKEERKKLKEEKKRLKQEKHKKKQQKQKKQGKKKGKKQTKLGIQYKKNGEDFGEWYREVITKSELIEYYEISGCYIFRPWSYFIWETIQEFVNKEIRKLGVQNCYFPVFVTKKALETEKDHIEGFSPEVAWVTKSGSKDLVEPIAIRPTSETVMYPYYSKWIRSHTDLPLKMNQWCNVVRWEFKDPVPFIRGREFLWQEGHTAFATKKEAEEEVLQILDIYKRVYEELLAVPVTQGIKSASEKFAGGFYTTTVEAFVDANGRSVQGGTSHCLGQNFSKMFNIQFEDKDKMKKYAWQNSWGLSTRSLGVAVMVHGDDDGLVLPPRVAPIQVAIIPLLFSKDKDKDASTNASKKLETLLKKLDVRVKVDERSQYRTGWKYNYWELRGVPLRIEIGERDISNNQVICVRRDTREKITVSMDGIGNSIDKLLKTIQSDLLKKATKVRDAHRIKIMNWKDFVPTLNKKNVCLVPWCNTVECEKQIKERSKKESEVGEHKKGQLSGKAKSLCIPYENQKEKIPEGTPCFACTKDAKVWCLFGRSY